MKKRIIFICILMFSFVKLLGCTSNINTATTPTNTHDVPQEWDIYFATGNDYYDLYVGYSWIPGPEIVLLSKEYINPESIQVTADIQAEYVVHVNEHTTGASLIAYEVIESNETRNVFEISRDEGALPLYLYQTYAGIDWDDVGQKYSEYVAMKEKHDAAEVDYAQVEASLNRYNYAATEYIKDYSELTVDDLPLFYEYLIQIQITDAEIEEELSTIHVTIGNASYDVNIGKIYIRPFLGTVENAGYDYFSLKQSSPLWFNSYPYGQGIEKCRSEIYYAEKALTLTGLHFLENKSSTIKVLDVVAYISDDPYLESGINIEWDGYTPIYVEQGKYVGLIITFQDNRLKEITYHGKIYPVWEFVCEDSNYEIITEIPLSRYYAEKWLLYALGVSGLDMESYFNDYHYLTTNEIWRNDVDLTPWGQEQ